MADETTRPSANIGLRISGAAGDNMRDFMVWHEGREVMVRAEVVRRNGQVVGANRRLEPHQALAFAKAFERCAVAALKESA